MDKFSQHKRRSLNTRGVRRGGSTPALKYTRRTTAQRRDSEQPVKVRTSQSSWDTIYGKGSGLKAVRDTGLLLSSHENLQERMQHSRRIWIITVLVVLALLIPSLLYYWMLSSNAKAEEALKDMNSNEVILESVVSTETTSSDIPGFVLPAKD